MNIQDKIMLDWMKCKGYVPRIPRNYIQKIYCCLDQHVYELTECKKKTCSKECVQYQNIVNLLKKNKSRGEL